MKYIDVDLSPENRALLDAWIERRESRKAYRDIRSARDRQWWECQQSYAKRPKATPIWTQFGYANQLQQAQLNQGLQSSEGIAALNAYGLHQQQDQLGMCNQSLYGPLR